MQDARLAVSIVMVAYKRAKQLESTLHSIEAQHPHDCEVIVVEDGDDGGDTKSVCEEYGVRYIQRADRPDVKWSNPAIPLNIGLRAANGDIVLLQNAECRHSRGEVIAELREVPEGWAWFAPVMALNKDGKPGKWYCGKDRPVPWFFCGSFRRALLDKVGYFDESFTGYGGEDKEFAQRLFDAGTKFRWLSDENMLVLHQWHEHTDGVGL